MRYTRYPTRGKPSTVTQTLDELVMLLQASLSIANTERWALERGEPSPPPALAGLLRTSAYEVTVVDQFHRLARRHFERAKYRSVWERPFQTGKRGRPPSIDMSLFDKQNGMETRIELGLYTKSKLEAEAKRLDGLKSQTVTGYTSVRNLIALWNVRSTRLTAMEATKWMHTFINDAKAVSGATLAVSPLLASTIDLFAVEQSDRRHAVVGLFEVP